MLLTQKKGSLSKKETIFFVTFLLELFLSLKRNYFSKKLESVELSKTVFAYMYRRPSLSLNNHF